MKKPVVDYRAFRLSRINEKQYRHLWLLTGWIVYFILYFLTENLIPVEKCVPMHAPLDDMIPFLEIFVIPYVFWYALIVITLVYFMLYNIQSFKEFSIFIIITQLVAMAIYMIFPNRQDLRPLVYPRDNFLTDLVALLQGIDTSTNVCPSLHVAYSIGIASAWLKEKGVSVLWKGFVVVSAILICMSTAFIKQHSVIDIMAAIPLSAAAEIIVYGKNYWIPKLRKN